MRERRELRWRRAQTKLEALGSRDDIKGCRTGREEVADGWREGRWVVEEDLLAVGAERRTN